MNGIMSCARILGLPVRVQISLDNLGDLNNGGFLAHRSNLESADEYPCWSRPGLGPSPVVPDEGIA
jgi:hypothetical protein